jgi:hypothetical protein
MTESPSAIRPEISLDSVPAPVTDVRVEVIEGELLLYHPEQTRAIYLNPSAAVIWSLCDGQRRAREIIDLIGESYSDASANLAEDVLATLAQLRESHVLTMQPDSFGRTSG